MRISVWRVLLGMVGCIFLCVYAGLNPRDPQLFQVLKDPSAYVGKTIQLYVETRIEKITADGFLLSQGDVTLRVRGTFDGLVVGNQVGVSGVYQQDGSLLASDMGSADPTPREFRKWISVLGLLIVGVCLLANLRWTRDGVEMRSHA